MVSSLALLRHRKARVLAIIDRFAHRYEPKQVEHLVDGGTGLMNRGHDGSVVGCQGLQRCYNILSIERIAVAGG